MRICFVTDSYPGLKAFGGIGVFTQRIGRSLVARGHEVHVVVAKSGRRSDEEDAGAKVHMRAARWLPVAGRWLPGLGESICVARYVAALHRQYKFDLVEVPNWEGIGFATTYLSGMKKVTRLHTSLAESIEMAARPATRAERFMIWMERMSARRADAVVTHSIAHKERMARTYGISEIEVIPHGVTIPREVTDPVGKTVLAIGKMNARKGMETLLEAIPLVLKKAPEARFQIVGTAEDHPKAREFREKQREAAERVDFLGMVNEERLHDLYNGCAVYVSPATYESFGLTFAEAMAHGRPVVGCNASAVPEIVRDRVDGLLVPAKSVAPLAEAIARLVEDEEMRKRMGAAARKRAVESYSLEVAAGRVERFFEGVVGRN